MTAPSDEAQRIRSYLVTQAAKLSVAEIVDKLRRDTPPLWDAAAALPAGRLGERPAAEEWSAFEVLTHVLAMNDHGVDAIDGIIGSGAPPRPVADELRHERRTGFTTVEQYRQAWLQRREPFLVRVLQAAGDEHLDVTIAHPRFGPLNWREWLLFMRIHDLDHMRQLQTLDATFAS